MASFISSARWPRTLGVMNASPTPRRATFTVVAFIVSPLVAAFCLSFAGAVTTANSGLVELIGWTVVFYPYAAIAAVVLGLPSFLILRKFGAIRWWSTMLVGVAVGIIVFAFVFPGGTSAVFSDPRSLACGSIGAFSAFIFWLIWRQGHLRAANS